MNQAEPMLLEPQHELVMEDSQEDANVAASKNPLHGVNQVHHLRLRSFSAYSVHSTDSDGLVYDVQGPSRDADSVDEVQPASPRWRLGMDVCVWLHTHAFLPWRLFQILWGGLC